MKMYYETKEKMKKQRLKRIKEYYDAYDTDWRITLMSDKKLDRHTILSKQQLNDEYYFVVQTEGGAISLVKLVYSAGVTFVRVSKASKKYVENKGVFDSWIKEAKENV